MTFPWWDKNSPALFDQILFLPSLMQPFALPQEGPFEVELCSGNGSWIVDRALAHPELFWIAVEKKMDRAKKIWLRAKRLQAANLLVVAGEAENFIDNVLPPQTASCIYINFPDPWPKRRHAKHRLLKEPFVSSLKAKLQKGGRLFFVTDDETYLQEAENLLQPALKKELGEEYGSSFFDQLWRSHNKTIYCLEYAH